MVSTLNREAGRFALSEWRNLWYVTGVKREELRKIHAVFYDPAERARQKAAQRLQDERDIAAGRLREVEERNHWLRGPFGVSNCDWETEPLLS